MEAAPACVNRENTGKEKMQPSLAGGLLVFLLAAVQVGPAWAYDCSVCMSSSSMCVNAFWTGYLTCNNGVGDALHHIVTADVSHWQGHGLPGCNGKRNNITIHLQTNVELKSRITAFDGDGQCVVHSDDADHCIGQELLSADMHFGVCVPEFMTADVSQGHGLPGCNGKRNNITIYLQTNVELKSSYTFTISGLHVSNVQYETGFGYDAQVSIAETASESEIHVAGENFTADTVYEIIVSALNTGDAEEYSRDSLTVSATAFDNPLSKSLEELTGMEVEAVDMTASIRQTAQCPFAINTLTFEMQTNVVLPVGATITISGLTKTSSHTPTLDLFSCSTSSSSESMLSKEAAWNAAPLGSAADRVIVCGS